MEADDVRPLARPINSKALGELPKSQGISTHFPSRSSQHVWSLGQNSMWAELFDE